MTTVDRKEFQETKILRTRSPARNYKSSTQNLEQFDSNLDYLLEDLQNSVSRPGSSLGNANSYKESTRTINTLDSGKSNSLNRIANVKGSNPVAEYNSDDAYSYTSPDGRKKVEGYKREYYSHKISGDTNVQPEKSRVQNSINQLDSLLDDLQQVKKSQSYSEKEYSKYESGSSPDFPNGKISNGNVRRELNYGDSSRGSSRSHTFERTEKESSLRDIEYSNNEGQYGQVRNSSPSSRTSTLSKEKKVTNVHAYPVEVIETLAPEINPEVLSHLDPSLHPPGNTKVTTTIKTYTYEIPGSGNFPTDLNSTLDSTLSTSEHNIYSLNNSQSTPSKSFVYNKLENKSAQNTVSYPKETKYETSHYKESKTSQDYLPYKKPNPPGGHNVVKETVTTRNYQPGYNPEISPPNQETYFYNESTTTKNFNEYKDIPKSPVTERYLLKETNNNYIDEYPVRNVPSTKQTYIYKESHNTSNRNYPVESPITREKFVHKEISNITNTHDYYPSEPSKTIVYERESNTTNNYLQNKPKSPILSRTPSFGKPNEPLNIKYKYTNTSSTTNNYRTGYPENEPLLPKPFPTEDRIDGPPKKLDELMANIGHEPPNSPYNAGYNAHEKELVQQKKVSALKQATEADDMVKKEPVPKTKNMSGPAVYYPPGHELFSKKEEGGGAWRAEGAYQKEAGKYNYGAEEKSKTKGGQGAAIVPVCCPLCCGLPCTII